MVLAMYVDLDVNFMVHVSRRTFKRTCSQSWNARHYPLSPIFQPTESGAASFPSRAYQHHQHGGVAAGAARKHVVDQLKVLAKRQRPAVKGQVKAATAAAKGQAKVQAKGQAQGR